MSTKNRRGGLNDLFAAFAVAVWPPVTFGRASKHPPGWKKASQLLQ
jgi:hypothetical protein